MGSWKMKMKFRICFKDICKWSCKVYCVMFHFDIGILMNWKHHVDFFSDGDFKNDPAFHFGLTFLITCSIFNSASRGRVYLPQDELAQAGLSDNDIFASKVTDKWRNFMKSQIKRARMFFDEAEKGVTELNEASRWPVRKFKHSSLYKTFSVLKIFIVSCCICIVCM